MRLKMREKRPIYREVAKEYQKAKGIIGCQGAMGYTEERE